MEKIHAILTWANIVGIPTLFATVIWIGKKLIIFGKQMKILMNAQQKQMRRELTIDYHKYIDQGYIDDDDLELWEAGYQAYQDLGQNGIMDKRREQLIELNGRGKPHEEA